jgi:hypothetical protein
MLPKRLALIGLVVGSLMAASPSPSATAFVDTACTQAAATSTNALTVVTSSFFTSIVPNGRTICLSAWDLSSNVVSALETAAHNGASVTVITPLSQNRSNSAGIATIVAAGGHAKYEYTSSPGTPASSIAYQQAPMDIHAKFALIDGVAYMDGHNWFNTDVVMRDGFARDFAAIQADLTAFPALPPSGNGTTFSTDKQISLHTESDYIQGISGFLNASSEFDFITESFNPNPPRSGPVEYNDDVYAGLCQIAASASAPTMHVIVERFSGYSSTARAALQNLMLHDPNAFVRTDNHGHEKISMFRPAAGGAPLRGVWFGSSNSTTTDLFDWGMDLSDTGVMTALASYFDAEWSGASPIPAASPGVSASPCPSLHL